MMIHVLIISIPIPLAGYDGTTYSGTDPVEISIPIPLAGYDSKNAHFFYIFSFFIMQYYFYHSLLIIKIKTQKIFDTFLHIFQVRVSYSFHVLLPLAPNYFYKIKVSSTSIPRSTPKCSTFAL